MKFRLFIVLILTVNFCFPQQTEYVDFKTAKVSKLMVDTACKGIGGNMVYEFEILKDIDSIYLDAKGFRHIEGLLNERIYHDYDGKHFIVKHKFIKGEKHKLHIGWYTQPKKALYFIEKDEGNQVWTQGQGKYTSNWLPSIDDMNDKIEFDLSITSKRNYEVIANGHLTNKQINDSTITWHYDMQKPMSSYLVAMAIGNYDKKVEYSKSGIPLEMYYYPEDSLKFEPTYRYTKLIFDFLEEEIGVPYPWQNYKMLPVKDFLYAGMENTSLNIYSDAFVVDSTAFVDRNFVNINAHELAHQWFGDLVTEVSGTHHWLQEGFATYYALLAEKEVFGEDYYYWQLYEYAQELLEQDKAGNSTSLLNPKSSSTTFYKKGAWVLHMLREQVGEEPFREAVKNYLLKHQFKNVETDDFISEVEKSSGVDLSEFVEKWLKSPSLVYDDMIRAIISNRKIEFLNSLDELKIEIETSDIVSNSDELKQVLPILRALSIHSSSIDYKNGELLEFHKIAFASKDIKVRQAIAKNMPDIPLELKADYESLLDDKSYITIETALVNLWINFPENQSKYLDKTKNITGLNNKNIRIPWLALALLTKDYELENKKQYYNELMDYTSPRYASDIRENAFFYLHQIKACNDVCKENLKQATTHHNWRFKKFAKGLLKSMK
ncbi:M1 family metallopeptidase [Seonamhaeicola sp. ML3]|uniref:M1 family metallopeptidase n=1 Tax=Seonamhaeicola sp. ML3 TaxID=2937786 RepID=UPI00200C30B6|nr:M1 family metallopeptidase [Seonamhaeicola sp. ML3]